MQQDDNISIDSLFAQNLNDEISIFEDRLIIDQIKTHEDRLDKLKEQEVERRKREKEAKIRKGKEEEY